MGRFAIASYLFWKQNAQERFSLCKECLRNECELRSERANEATSRDVRVGFVKKILKLRIVCFRKQERMTTMDPFEQAPAMFLRVSSLDWRRIKTTWYLSCCYFGFLLVVWQKSYELVNSCDPVVATWYVRTDQSMLTHNIGSLINHCTQYTGRATVYRLWLKTPWPFKTNTFPNISITRNCLRLCGN